MRQNACLCLFLYIDLYHQILSKRCGNCKSTTKTNFNALHMSKILDPLFITSKKTKNDPVFETFSIAFKTFCKHF